MALATLVDGSDAKDRTVFSPAIEPLLSKVGYGGIGRNDSETALRLLVKIGPPAVPSVLKALKSREDRLRRCAIEILVLMRPEGVPLVETIAPFVADPHEFVSRQAIQDLGQLGEKASAAVPLLQKRVDTKPPPFDCVAVPPSAGTHRAGRPDSSDQHLWISDEHRPARSFFCDLNAGRVR